MANDSSPYKHDASDRKLDEAAESTEKERQAASERHPTHDPQKIRKHNDTGKDRMFEGREQHDEIELRSEKNRLAKDQDRHNHPRDGEDVVTESNMHVKRKH
jgi:hypothetical protein